MNFQTVRLELGDRVLVTHVDSKGERTVLANHEVQTAMDVDQVVVGDAPAAEGFEPNALVIAMGTASWELR